VGLIAQHLKYPYAEIGTPAVILLAFVIYFVGKAWIFARNHDDKERYRKRSALATILLVLALAAIVVLWARTLHNTSTFLGLVGGGLAIALKEPLLAIAGRIAILAGHAYSVGDRIQIEKVTGDVIDVGFFYTRMMEVGNWLTGDQATGRIVQFSNSRLFGDTAVYNYTRDFSYIWDEIRLPVTYASNLKATKDILVEAGSEYTKAFLQGAQQELTAMQRYFVVGDMELKPQVYMSVTDNWVELTLRYLVEPRKRRAASNFIYERAFERLQGRSDITIASSTSDVAIHWKEDQSSSGEKARQEAPDEGRKAA
jgi:small-conductance mechanosensitive channel